MRKRNGSRHRSRKTRSDSRTIPIHGTDEDEGVWFECWWCGFTCNKDRDGLGGPESRDGVGYEEVIRAAPGASSGDPLSAIGLLDSDLDYYQTALAADSQGNEKLPDLPSLSNTSSGCPQCGSRNWLGEF